MNDFNTKLRNLLEHWLYHDAHRDCPADAEVANRVATELARMLADASGLTPGKFACCCPLRAPCLH